VSPSRWWQASGREGSFRARADVVEYLGSQELLHVTSADRDIVAIVGSEHRVRPGDLVNLVLPLDKLHLFDAETGLSVAPAIAALAASPAVAQQAAPAPIPAAG